MPQKHIQDANPLEFHQVPTPRLRKVLLARCLFPTQSQMPAAESPRVLSENKADLEPLPRILSAMRRGKPAVHEPVCPDAFQAC